MEYKSFELPNKIRALHCADNGRVAHVAIMINTGTRDELPDEHGIAHFIEHMLFKGTAKRKSWHINNRLDAVGGEINAFTTKEETCVHATILTHDYERAVELLADIVFNSIFAPKEIEKEKEVVLDEINSYNDSPAELIYDDYEDMMYAGNAIGRNILGTPESLMSIDRDKILRFMTNNYHTDQIVISSWGNIPHARFERIVAKYFGALPANIRQHRRQQPSGYVAQRIELNKHTHQAHCVVGCPSYSLFDSRRIPLSLMMNILGGPGLNSRLNNSLRERHGLAYSVEANGTFYSDTGLIAIYFGTEKSQLNRCIALVTKELEQLKQPMTDGQLHKAKRQIMGQIAIAQENNESKVLGAGKRLLHTNVYVPIEEVIANLNGVTAAQIAEISTDLFTETLLSYLIFA